MRIILGYIGKASYHLVFGNSEKSTEFLMGLSMDTLIDDNPDSHFISVAYRTIKRWFDEKMRNNPVYADLFYTQVALDVQVIWYQLEELGEIEKMAIFERLNSGKIPLTDAELIRALLLSRIKDDLHEREAAMRQAEISAEWNAIEHALQQDSLWCFLTNDAKEYSSRVEYIFSIMAGEKAKDYSTYLWFEDEVRAGGETKESNNATALWDRTKAIFAKFKVWHNNTKIYHLVGFLLADHYPVDRILEASNTTKSAFRSWLIGEAKVKVITVTPLCSLHQISFPN